MTTKTAFLLILIRLWLHLAGGANGPNELDERAHVACYAVMGLSAPDRADEECGDGADSPEDEDGPVLTWQAAAAGL